MSEQIDLARKLQKLKISDIENAIQIEKPQWAHQCHMISIALVRSGFLGTPGVAARVARGMVPGINSQHSWVVMGKDCYDVNTVVLDLTLWSYEPSAPVVYSDLAKTWPHTPHQSGSIIQTGMPIKGDGPIIELNDQSELSPEAKTFLNEVGPLDIRGWFSLAHTPVGGWPSAEIIKAMYNTPCMKALIPIDIVGMLTDENPSNLYF